MFFLLQWGASGKRQKSKMHFNLAPQSSEKLTVLREAEDLVSVKLFFLYFVEILTLPYARKDEFLAR